MAAEPLDIRDEIFRSCMGKRVTGVLVAEAAGIVSGVSRAKNLALALGLAFASVHRDSDQVQNGAEIARVTGNPIQVVRAEEVLIGAVSKSSGIATRAWQARKIVEGRLRVVAGGWKKVPHQIRDIVRQAVGDGGLESRISDSPFVYLDKNYVRIMGGIEAAIGAVSHLRRSAVVQIRGETGPIGIEAVQAARCGAAIVMIDTGKHEDIPAVNQALLNEDLRDRIVLAFAGNISVEDLERDYLDGVEVVDIGYDILDAPALPVRFDVVGLS